MNPYRYVIADVFTDTPLEGNGLAVFTQATGIDDRTMARLAREMNLSETVFARPLHPLGRRKESGSSSAEAREIGPSGCAWNGSGARLHGASGAIGPKGPSARSVNCSEPPAPLLFQGTALRAPAGGR